MGRRQLLTGRQRTALMILSTLLTLLSVTFTVMVWGGFTPNNIALQLGSIEYRNASVVYVQQDEFKILSSRYKGDRDEFIYCMYGTAGEDHYVIQELKETSYTADSESVRYEPCKANSGYLGTIHSHPQPNNPRYISTCDMSTQDIYTFGGDGAVLSAIICGEEDIAFYESDDLEIPIAYEVIKEES